ncbi:MAG: microcin transport system substrate-binding protein [Alphaproteobacteria bacterium]|nr:microcin transport system substrate-binding protein [Alphaproteobacteria bacterium]
MRLTRRAVFQAGVFALASPALSAIGGRAAAAQSAAAASAPSWRHGLSLFGDLRYPAGFKHFDYVNPAAPKGGTVRLIAGGQTFDNLNLVVSGVKGNLAAGVDLLYDSLMAPALDEVSAEYGLLAESVSYPDDYSSVTYRLRANAKWHDGKPVTPEDVIFSLEAFKKNHPQLSAYYRHVTKAEKIGEREIAFTFDQPGNRELPQIVGQLSVMPKHYWEGTDKSGNKRDIGATTLEAPLGNGAYRIKEFTPGRTIVYERVQDYWGKAISVNIGRDNFDQIRFEYFRDSTVALEALKADHVDWRTENSAKSWATSYDFPAVQEKRVMLEEFPIRNVGVMQAFAFNIRRDKFQDARVRRAFNYAFDFEEMNKQLFYGQYKRIASYFEGTELAARDLPQGEELKILESIRDKVPAEVFTRAYTNPVGGNPENVRNNLREAVRLLKEAGFEVRDRKLVDSKNGEAFRVEFLVDNPNTERFVLFYKPSLERLGIDITVRTVDDAQYANRERNWDFDIVITNWGQSLSPGNEQRGFWSSQAADQPGSRNLVGIKNPAVDAMIERVIFAKNREELVAATKALDRVLLWNHYVVPQFTYDKVRTARWDRFARPEKMPTYGMAAFPTIWWWDEAKASKTGSRS